MTHELAEWMKGHPIVLFWLIVFTMALVYLGSKTIEWHYKANQVKPPKIHLLKGILGDDAINYVHILRKTEMETVSKYRIMSYWIMALMYLMVLILLVLGVSFKLASR